jgi:hypothetical protein
VERSSGGECTGKKEGPTGRREVRNPVLFEPETGTSRVGRCMQLVVSDGIPRPEYVARINHSWVNQEVVEATAELQLLPCQDRPRWDPRVGQEGLILAQRDQAWLARCEPVVPRPAKFHWSTQCRAERRRRRRQSVRDNRVRGDWELPGQWYLTTLLCGLEHLGRGWFVCAIGTTLGVGAINRLG